MRRATETGDEPFQARLCKDNYIIVAKFIEIKGILITMCKEWSTSCMKCLAKIFKKDSPCMGPNLIERGHHRFISEGRKGDALQLGEQ